MKNLTISRIISSDIPPMRRTALPVRAVRISRTALPKKCLLLLLVFVCSLAPAGNSFGQANQKAKQAANQAKAKQEQRAMLTQKYGFNIAQIQQYEALEKTRDDKIVVIKNTPGLTQKERKQKIGACHRDFQASVDEMLSPQQLAVKKAEEPKSDKDVQSMLKSYRKERAAIRGKKDITPSARTEALAQLDKNYESRLAVIFGEEQAHRIMKRQEYNRNANTQDVKKYNLSYSDAQKYNNLNKATKQRQDKLDNTTLTQKDRAEKNDQLKARQESKFKTLLGNIKFSLWHKDHNPTVDQRLKSRYGFSDQQLQQYKDLQNQQAAAIVKIRQSKGTSAQKQASIVQARAETEQKLQQVLTPEQYGKMAADKQKAKNSERRKAIDAHTVKPVPKAK